MIDINLLCCTIEKKGGGERSEGLDIGYTVGGGSGGGGVVLFDLALMAAALRRKCLFHGPQEGTIFLEQGQIRLN